MNQEIEDDQFANDIFVSDFKLHQSLNQPVRQLLAQQYQEFRTTIIRLFPSQTYNPDFKRLDNNIDVLKMRGREDVENKLDSLLAEQVASSHVNGRYFGQHWQLALHSFIKNLYFERKQRAKKNEAILKEYSSLAAKLTSFDDLIIYLKLIFSLSVIPLQQEIHAELGKALKHSEEGSPFSFVFTTLNEEERLILEFYHAQAGLLHFKQSKAAFEGVFEKIAGKLQTNPYNKLLTFILQSNVKSEIGKVIEAFIRGKIIADYQQNTYVLQAKGLHPELQGEQTIKLIINKLQAKDLLRILSANSLHIESKTIKIKYNLEIISLIIDCIEKEYVDKIYDGQSFTSLINTFRVLLEHHTYQFITVNGGTHKDEHFNFKYISKLFLIVEKLFNKEENSIVSNFNEALLLKWVRTLNQWILYYKLEQQPFVQQSVKSLFIIFYISSLNQNEEITDFPTILEETSELSQEIKKLAIAIDKFPRDWHACKGVRKVVFGWGQAIVKQTQEIRTILRKLIESIFTPQNPLHSSAYSSDLFDAAAISKPFKKMLSKELSEGLQKQIIALQKQNITHKDDPKAKLYISLIAKISIIVSTKIPFDFMDSIVRTIYNIYIKYAHVWPLMGSFRLWIMQVHHDTVDNHLYDKLQATHKAFDSYDKLLQKHIQDATQLGAQALPVFRALESKAYELINCLHLTKIKQSRPEQFYNKYFQLLGLLQARQQKWNGYWSNKQTELSSWIKLGVNFDLELHVINTELKLIVRYFLCNSTKLLAAKEEEFIMNNISLLYTRTIQENGENPRTYKFINDLLGFSKNKSKTILQAKQILGSQHPYTSRFNPTLKIEDFAPFNFLSTLYSSLRPRFDLLLRAMFGALSKRDGEQIWQNLQKILFMPVTISGSCIFNDKMVEKSKEEMVLGIYIDQYQNLTEVLTQVKQGKQNISIVLQLEKRKILSKFFQVMKLKTVKIVEKARNNPPDNRFRARQQQTVEDIIQNLEQLGVTRQYAQIALENIDYPDQNLAIEWIDNNRNQVEQQLMMRVLQKSNAEKRRSQPAVEEKSGNGIKEINMDKFKKEMMVFIKSWIKFVYKELFQNTVIQEIYKIKDILFLCMDYLDEKDKSKQYTHFNDKIYKDLDQLNKENNIDIKLKLLVSIMESMVDKLPRSRALFYQKNINMKTIGFLPRLKTEADQVVIFSLLNSYLPIITPDILTPELEEYLHYLLDLTYQYKIESKAIIQIFYKIAKSNKQALIERTTRNIVEYLSLNLIKESIVPILNIVFESDRQLSLVNAELDLKTFIYERYKHRISSFHPEKEHLLQMDIKEFGSNFVKYQKDGSIYEACKKILAKKKNKNKFFYDCRKEQNAFDYSVFAKERFISYGLKDYQKTIIRSLISILIKSPIESQQELMGQIHKILSYYRILIPFALNENVQGTSLLPWLLECPNHSKRKYKLLVFLMLNCNILIRNGSSMYGFYSIGEFACAKAIAHLTTKNYQDGNYHSILSCFYLQQVRKFAQFCTTSISSQNKLNLVNLFESILEKASSMQYLAISQFLNLQYKRSLLDNLRRKYKIIGSESQTFFERQFLSLSPFYNSISAKTAKSSEPRVNNPFDLSLRNRPYEDLSESEELDPTGWRNPLLHQNPYLSIVRRGQQQQESFYEPLIAPLPQKPEKQGANEEVLEPIVIVNNFTIAQVIHLFEQYLCFDIEIQDKFPLVLAILSHKIIKINENLNFKVNLLDATTDIQIKVRKNAGFERHFAEIMQVIEPKIIWEEKKAASNFDKRVQQISRRIFSGDNNASLQHRQDMLQQLQRLMIGRENREQEQPIQPSRLLNTNDIFANIAEFTDPIVPVIPKEVEMEVEHKVEKEKQQQIPIQPVVNNVAQEPIPIINVQVNQQENIPVQLEQNIQPAVQNIPQPEVQHIQLIQPVQPVQPAQDIEQPADIIEHQLQQILNIEQDLPIQPVVIPSLNNPPPRDRQILRVFGLPQTFLRDAGIDQESFDCLPQDFQQEQLMHFISQQNNALNRTNSQNNQGAGNVPLVVDQQSENLAFLASLDMQTRAQVLIQATPQFLNTLPANIRQQAENYRHQQINRIIEQEQIEQEQKLNKDKPRANIVYPKVKKEQFTKISQQAAKKLFQGIFYVFPNFKLSAIKILLENKQNQGKTIATLIALLRYLQQKEPQRLFALKKVERQGLQLSTVESFKWSEQQTQNIRNNLLHTVYQHLRIPFYKDEEFLSQKFSTEIYLPQISHVFEGQDSIEVQIQLFQFSLKYYPTLSSELIKGIKELPDRLLIKIVQGIKTDSLPKDFYENLQNFSDNQKLKQLFSTYFQHERPKIQVLGRLLKYNFSHVPYLRRVHQQALQFFSNSYYDFLNQIFRIYTIQTLHEVQSMLVKYKQIHFEVIKYLLQLSKQIEKEPIGILLKRPQLLDFETKKFIFRNHPRIRKLSRHRVHIEVDRAHLFQGSYNQLMSRTLRELQGRIQVSFVNEPGYDAGGLKRQWFLVVSRQIFNQDYALFEKSSSGSTYQPNPKSYINPDHLNYFKFIGRFIGKALVQRQLIDAYFTRAFYKMILGQQLQFKDLQAQDYEFYKSMQWLKNNPIDENMFTFSYIYDNFGNKIEKELISGGKEIIVNEQNKKEYIEKYCLSKMRDDFSTQVGKFLEGFYQIVPQECISFFQAKELQLLISGVPEVDIDDLKKNTDYSGYVPTDQIILWFWEVVEEYSQEDLAKLVQFITGTSKIPVEGFSQIVGMNGIQRISIHRDPCEHQLPKSHTCFNQLDLPNYASKQILKEKLAICLAWGSQGFGFM